MGTARISGRSLSIQYSGYSRRVMMASLPHSEKSRLSSNESETKFNWFKPQVCVNIGLGHIWSYPANEKETRCRWCGAYKEPLLNAVAQATEEACEIRS